MKKPKQQDIMGSVVVDQVTEFKGIVTGIVYQLSGGVMGNVTPKVGKDGKMAESWGIDLDRLTVQRAGPVKATPPDDTSHIQLGARAKDRISGVEGVMTEKVVYLNGCTHVCITAPSAKKDERLIVVDWKRLDISDAAPVMTAPEPATPGKGGPSRRVEAEG